MNRFIERGIEQGFVRSADRHNSAKKVSDIAADTVKDEKGSVTNRGVFIGAGAALIAAGVVFVGFALNSRGETEGTATIIDTPTPSAASTPPPEEDTPTSTLIPAETLEPTPTLKPAPKEGEPLFDFTFPPEITDWMERMQWIENNRDVEGHRDMLASNQEVEILEGPPQGDPPPTDTPGKIILLHVFTGEEETASKWLRGLCDLFGENGTNNAIPRNGIRVAMRGTSETTVIVPNMADVCK